MVEVKDLGVAGATRAVWYRAAGAGFVTLLVLMVLAWLIVAPPEKSWSATKGATAGPPELICKLGEHAEVVALAGLDPADDPVWSDANTAYVSVVLHARPVSLNVVPLRAVFASALLRVIE